MIVRQGHRYRGGAAVPFFVTSGMLVDGATAKGFSQVQVTDRDAAGAVAVPAGSSDDWDTLVQGTWTQPDGDLAVPSAVRWVVDTTPAAPGPAPTPGVPAPPLVTAGPPSSWVDVPGMPGKVRPGVNVPFAVGLGVVGGLAIASWGFSHVRAMLSEGLDDAERKNLLKGAGLAIAIIGGTVLWQLDKQWWWTTDGIAKKAQEQIP